MKNQFKVLNFVLLMGLTTTTYAGTCRLTVVDGGWLIQQNLFSHANEKISQDRNKCLAKCNKEISNLEVLGVQGNCLLGPNLLKTYGTAEFSTRQQEINKTFKTGALNEMRLYFEARNQGFPSNWARVVAAALNPECLGFRIYGHSIIEYDAGRPDVNLPKVSSISCNQMQKKLFPYSVPFTLSESDCAGRACRNNQATAARICVERVGAASTPLQFNVESSSTTRFSWWTGSTWHTDANCNACNKERIGKIYCLGQKLLPDNIVLTKLVEPQINPAALLTAISNLNE